MSVADSACSRNDVDILGAVEVLVMIYGEAFKPLHD